LVAARFGDEYAARPPASVIGSELLDDVLVERLERLGVVLKIGWAW
jgi:hypothetical protein